LNPNFRVVVTDYGFPDLEFERQIAESAGAEFEAFQCKTEQQVIAAAKDADAVLVQFAPVTRAVINELSRCKVIVRYGVGIDNIDIEAARERGIIVCNVPNYCIDEVADHTFAFALCLTRQVALIDAEIRRNEWNNTPARSMPASRQMTFVTLGFGRLARAVLDRAAACKFKIAACDPYLPAETAASVGIANLSLDEALATADVLSLHVPLNDASRHIVNARTLALLKPTSVLINTARGGLVDGVALADALNRGALAGAGLDVFEKEPLPLDHPLRSCSNALLSSHIAWYSEMSGGELQKMAAEEAIRALRGEPLQSRIV
jgi:D-3-phosphoglycerate dehydrogenase